MASGVRLILAGLFLSLSAAASANTDGTADAAGVAFFETKVRPVLAEHCHKCHSGESEKLKGGLLLDSREGALKGGDSGPAVVAGEPERSLLIEAIRYGNVDLQMPPKARLSDQQIRDLEVWVEMGAPWPAGAAAAAAREEFDLEKRRSDHWAWRAIAPQAVPALGDEGWARGDIDRFILARLEEKGLRPARPADRHTLIRRLSFALVGLPPSAEEIEAFAADDSPGAVERLVDRLLHSQHFGERWGRHWLDLVRYAESRGHEFDFTIPNAWQYRDYVIRALNADVPYDQLIIEHIAGDLLERPRLHPVHGFNESILGTGFWFLGEWVHSPVDIRRDEMDRIDNMIDVMGKASLGLTIACARCHDHKFDAISTKDYYALAAVLESSGYRHARFESMERNRLIARELDEVRETARAPLMKAVAEAQRPTVQRLADWLMAARDSVRLEGVEAAAARHDVDAARLKRWVELLRDAEPDAGDPLHLWARLAHQEKNGDAGTLDELVSGLVKQWRRHVTAAEALGGGRVIIDYATAGPDEWFVNGNAFGLRPVRPGDVELAEDAAWPIARVIDAGAARKSPVWDALRLAPGCEPEPGAIGDKLRPGAVLKSPTFIAGTGKVYYLVTGAGTAYASVDSHRVIEGPLHGKLVLRWRDEGPEPRWVEHDLNGYEGHRVHIEFSPAQGKQDGGGGLAEMSVLMVVEAPSRPAEVGRANRLLISMLQGRRFSSARELAEAYQELFAGALQRMVDDRIHGSSEARDIAQLANWLATHPDLLVEKRGREAVAEAARPFLQRQKQLVSGIGLESQIAMAMFDGMGVDGRVLIRGNHRNIGERVPRRFLEAIDGRPLPGAGSGRLELARRMVDPQKNPLIARVIVNRVWHHLFGRGIVASVDDFGVMGQAPTHPELLDWLADRFVKEGWLIKRLIRLIVLSSAYQMSSEPDPAAGILDPENRLLHRMNILRLEGEAVRDAMLAVSGRLDPRLFGPSVPVHLTEFMEGRGRPPKSGPVDGDGRRSIYTAVRRNFLPPMLLAFDMPTPFSTIGRRSVSNVPAQALTVMNDPFVIGQARLWAERLLRERESTRQRIDAIYLSALSRPPTEREMRACADFVAAQARVHGRHVDDVEVWADLCHAILQLKEFVFVP